MCIYMYVLYHRHVSFGILICPSSNIGLTEHEQPAENRKLVRIETGTADRHGLEINHTPRWLLEA